MTLSKRVGTLFGGDSVTIQGMSVREDDIIFCKFNESTVDGLFISENLAVCVTPPAKEESVVHFRIEIVRGSLNLTGGALFQYGKH